jgi:hypothetical protein
MYICIYVYMYMYIPLPTYLPLTGAKQHGGTADRPQRRTVHSLREVQPAAGLPTGGRDGAEEERGTVTLTLTLTLKYIIYNTI